MQSLTSKADETFVENICLVKFVAKSIENEGLPFFPRAHGEMYAMIAVSSSRYNTQADVLALQKDEDGMQAPGRTSQSCLLGRPSQPPRFVSRSFALVPKSSYGNLAVTDIHLKR